MIYTVIYNDRFIVGSHWEPVTKIVPVKVGEGQTLQGVLKDLRIDGSVVCILKGEVEPIEY